MRPLRIVHLSKECSGNGGTGQHLLALYQALEASGHEVYAVHCDRNVVSLPDGLIKDYFIEDLDTTDVLQVLETIRPQLIHIHNNTNYELESEIRKRYCVIKSLHSYEFCPSQTKYHHLQGKCCSHSTSLLCLPRMGFERCMLSKRPWVLWQYYRNARAANRNNAFYKKLIVASEYVKREAVASGYPARQIEVLPYFTTLPSEDLRTEAGENLVLFVGRVVPEKGVLHLLQAFSQIKTSATLMIAGAGMQMKQAREVCKKMRAKNPVKFVGWLDREQLDAMYRSASVVVVPSLWPEPFGIVGIEAMSYMKPVIAFNVGGISEWLEDRVTGFAIPPHDIQEMSEKIDHLLKSPDLAERMGSRGRKKVMAEFSAENHIKALLQIYQKVMDSKIELQAVTR